MGLLLTVSVEDWIVFQQIYQITLMHCKSLITKILGFISYIYIYFFNKGKIENNIRNVCTARERVKEEGDADYMGTVMTRIAPAAMSIIKNKEYVHNMCVLELNTACQCVHLFPPNEPNKLGN